MNKLKLAIALAVLSLTSICQVWASDDDIIQRGNIQTLSTSSVRVQGVSFGLVASTEYKDLNDLPISLSAFAVGDYVKVKGQLINNVLVAEELEKESDGSGSGDDNSGGNGGIDENNSGNNGNDDSAKDTESRLRARLASTGALARVTGSLESRKEKKSGRSSARFSGNIKVPAFNTTNMNEEISILVYRGATQIAACSLAFDRSGVDSRGNAYSEYKIDLVKKGSKVRTKKGLCDTDLTLEGTQLALPEIRSGDTVSGIQTVFDINTSAETETIINNGTFRRKR
jgi:hypothetical protein